MNRKSFIQKCIGAAILPFAVPELLAIPENKLEKKPEKTKEQYRKVFIQRNIHLLEDGSGVPLFCIDDFINLKAGQIFYYKDDASKVKFICLTDAYHGKDNVPEIECQLDYNTIDKNTVNPLCLYKDVVFRSNAKPFLSWGIV